MLKGAIRERPSAGNTALNLRARKRRRERVANFFAYLVLIVGIRTKFKVPQKVCL